MVHRGGHILLGVITLSLSSCSPDKGESASTTTEASASTAGSTGNPTTDATGTSSSTGSSTDPTTGSSTGSSTGGLTCPDAAQEGAACNLIEGQLCMTSPCQDPCQGCSFVECVDGIWVDAGSEVPGTCLDCVGVCGFVVAAGCAGGPADSDACIAECMANQAGACALAYDQMLFCIGEAPMVTCDAATRPTVVGCEDRFDELHVCLDG